MKWQIKGGGGHWKENMVNYVSDKEDQWLHNEGDDYNRMDASEVTNLYYLGVMKFGYYNNSNIENV